MISIFYYLLFLILTIVCSTSAFHINGFTLFQHEIEAELNKNNLIPCRFHTKRHLKLDGISLEWHKAIKGNVEPIPVIQLEGTHLKLHLRFKGKYDLFTTLVSKGNCTLVFKPSDIKDSGNYEARLTIKGKVFTPSSNIHVKVVEQKKKEAESQAAKNNKVKVKTTQPPIITVTKRVTAKPDEDFIDQILGSVKGSESTVVIILLVMTGALVVTLIVLIVTCVLHFRKGKEKPNDEENPKENESSNDEKSKGKKRPKDKEKSKLKKRPRDEEHSKEKKRPREEADCKEKKRRRDEEDSKGKKRHRNDEDSKRKKRRRDEEES